MLPLFPRSDVGAWMLPSHLTGSIIDGLKKHPVLSEIGSFFVYMSAWRVSVLQIIQGGPVSSSQARHGFHFYGPGGQMQDAAWRGVVGLL